ncbi:hypothetical protein BDZ89DRAFT_1112184 [Hymenopellis radicata]|nr:hypothetical protein BDZ89DRAFT_1112184 [Hymenopellis radicata]
MENADRPPFNPLFLAVPTLLLAPVLALDLAVFWKALFFLGYTAVTAVGLHSTAGDNLQNYYLGSAFSGGWITAFVLLFIVNPVRTCRHNTDKVHPSQYGIWYRSYWCLCIIFNLRGIGWNYQCTLPPNTTPTETRTQFVKRSLRRAILCYVILDATQIYILRNSQTFSSTAAQPFLTLAYPWRTLVIVMTAVLISCGLVVQYAVLGIIHVSLGLGEPLDWPNNFGSLKDAYTIRGFWGKTWHQMVTRNVTAVGKAVRNLFGKKKNSFAAYATLLVTAFAVSGLMHCGGDAMMDFKHSGKSMPFFLLQAAGIAFEQTVISAGNRLGIAGSGWRLVGFMWVGLWFNFSAVQYIDSAIQAGMLDAEALPFSPIRFVQGRLGL